MSHFHRLSLAKANIGSVRLPLQSQPGWESNRGQLYICHFWAEIAPDLGREVDKTVYDYKYKNIIFYISLIHAAVVTMCLLLEQILLQNFQQA